MLHIHDRNNVPHTRTSLWSLRTYISIIFIYIHMYIYVHMLHTHDPNTSIRTSLWSLRDAPADERGAAGGGGTTS